MGDLACEECREARSDCDDGQASPYPSDGVFSQGMLLGISFSLEQDEPSWEGSPPVRLIP